MYKYSISILILLASLVTFAHNHWEHGSSETEMKTSEVDRKGANKKSTWLGKIVLKILKLYFPRE